MEEAREVSEVREEGLEAKLRAAGGDLRALTPKERVVYYHLLCEKLSLDPALAPIQFLELDGKLRPYITRAGAEALRKVHGVSTSLLRSEVQEGLFVVAVRATLPDGRHEEAVAVADIRDKKGDALVNACLFAETKAKRRATLSLLGLGYFLDETEALSIPTARFASFDTETGEVTPAPSPSPEERRGGASDLVSKLRDYFLALGMRDKGVNGAVITALTGKPSFRHLAPEELEELLKVLGEVREAKGEGTKDFLTLLAHVYRTLVEGGVVLEEGGKTAPITALLQAPLSQVEPADLEALLAF